MQTTNIRQERGQLIATAKRAIKRMNASRYLVKSQSGNGKYVVSATKIGWVCSCPDQKFRGVKCKHIYALEISYAIRKEVEITKIEPLTNVNECIYCKSVTIVKDGLRHNIFHTLTVIVYNLELSQLRKTIEYIESMYIKIFLYITIVPIFQRSDNPQVSC